MYKKLIIIPSIIVLILLYNAVFIVEETQQAIVLEFGKPVKFNDNGKEVSFIKSAGLKFKIPLIQDVVFFDDRILNFEATDKEVLDKENKKLTVNAFAKYKITNPLNFYEKVTDINGINRTLDKIFEANLRDAIGSILLSELLTEERKGIMKKIQEDVTRSAQDFGIKIFDVRIVRADLPTENSQAIYKRMYAERSKEAHEYRAKGEEQARILRSSADKEATILLANSEKEAQIIRGQGDAQAIKIYADAFSKDASFYDFYRSMQAYKKSLDGKDTQLLLSTESEFLKYFTNVHGKR